MLLLHYDDAIDFDLILLEETMMHGFVFENVWYVFFVSRDQTAGNLKFYFSKSVIGG